MDERVRFCVLHDAGEATMSELCRQFGISRKTGYAVIGRWRDGGAAALLPRSHAPHGCSHGLDEACRQAVLSVRQRHPSWGPKKVKAWLQQHQAGVRWPAASTIGALFAREGLSVARKRRRRACPSAALLGNGVAANDVWCMDFKGWFVTGDGKRCEPLTMQDQVSRYLIRAVPVARTDAAHVWPVIEAAFREFGLPLALRSDNGPPFATTGAGGLSGLAVRLIKAGVSPERIAPARPQQNGRLERLHRTLKAETASPPAASLRRQGERLRRFRRIYNEERPHEALGQVTPASLYQCSPRPWSGRLVSPDYAEGVQVRRVRQNGEIKWDGGLIYLSTALVGEPVGVEETEDGVWQVRYGPVLLGTLKADGKLRRPPASRARKSCESVTHHAG
jgi:putative transposase